MKIASKKALAMAWMARGRIQELLLLHVLRTNQQAVVDPITRNNQQQQPGKQTGWSACSLLEIRLLLIVNNNTTTTNNNNDDADSCLLFQNKHDIIFLLYDLDYSVASNYNDYPRVDHRQDILDAAALQTENHFE